MSLHTQKNHYAALDDVHVNLDNRNHAFDEYGYGPLNPNEPNDEFWEKKAELFKTSIEEAKKSRCGNCAAFNQSKKIMKSIADGLGPAGAVIAEKAKLGFCEMFKFKCAAERTCDAWLVNGPITENFTNTSKVQNMKIAEEVTNSTGAAIPGTGDTGEAFKPRRRGKFANHETIVVERKTFLALREAKKKGKHWRKYLEEDDAYIDIREYARKKKGPIVVEDENTGACMFVRYGEGPLFEATENQITSDDRGWLSDAGRDARRIRLATKEDGGKEKYLGKFKGHYVRKTTDYEGTAYHLQDPKTKKITHSVNGSEKKGVFKVGGASTTGDSPVKMHDFYHHLIKKHVKALVGTDHSEGAKRVWQNLAKKRGVSLHGWHKGKAVNLDPKDEMETHAPRKPSYYSRDDREPEEKEVAATHLVASHHEKGAKKLATRKRAK